MSYDSWKLRSDLDDPSFEQRPDDNFVSQCDCCGQMKHDCRDIWVSYAGDTHVCPECRGEEDAP